MPTSRLLLWLPVPLILRLFRILAESKHLIRMRKLLPWIPVQLMVWEFTLAKNVHLINMRRLAVDTSAVDSLVVYTCQECASNNLHETLAMATSAVSNKDEETVAMANSSVDTLVVCICKECASDQDDETVAMATSAVDSLIVYSCAESEHLTWTMRLLPWLPVQLIVRLFIHVQRVSI